VHRNQFMGLLYGWIVILGLILISSVILALLLQFTAFNDPALSWTAFAAGVVSLFIGGFIAGAKGGSRGWIIGGITGLGFSLFIFLVQYLGYQQVFSLEQLFHHAGYVAAALLGGMIGVNLSRETKNE